MARPQAVPPEAATATPSPRPESEGTAAAATPLVVPLHLSELKTHHVTQLVEMAVSVGIENASRLRKQDLIFALLKNQAKKGASIFGDGTLEVLPDGFGFLRSPGHFLPREHRRHLRLALADPALQPAHRRLDRGRDPHAEGRRALLRAGQGRQGQRRGPRGGEEQDPVREPDAAASGQAVQARARDQGRREHHRARARHRRARSARVSAG